MSRTGKRALRALLICLLLAGSILVMAVLWITQNREWVKDTLIHEIARTLEQPCSIAHAEIRFTPVPTILLYGFTSRGRRADLSFGRAVVKASVLELCVGRVVPRYIALRDPDIHVHSPDDGQNGNRDLSQGLSLDDVTASFGCTIAIENGSLAVDLENGASVSLDGLDCYVRTGFGNTVQGDLSIRQGLFAMANREIRFSDILFLGDVVVGDFFLSDSRFDVKGHVQCEDWLESCDLRASVGKRRGKWRTRAQADGAFVKEGVLIPFFLDGRVELAGQQKLHITRADFGLGDRDRGALTGTCDLGKRSLSAQVSFERLSLTEWFGFGRVLPPGLQHTLDTITNGSLAVSLDTEGLRVTEASAECAGSVFRGYGGVRSWQRPTVSLHMQAETVDLIRGIPEAGARLPKPLTFSHAPLTPETMSPAGPGEVDVQYDIHLGADRLLYGPLSMKDARVWIHPSAKDVRGLQDVVLEAKAGFYEGALDGSCVIGGTQTTTFDISLGLSNVQGSGLGRAMPVLPVRRGRWAAQVRVASQGTDLAYFLRRLSGSVRVEGRNGEIQLPQMSQAVSFSSLQARLDPLRYAQRNGSMLGLDGIWKCLLEKDDMQVNCDLTGLLWFGSTGQGAGISFQNVPAGLSVRLDGQKFSLPQTLVLQSRMKATARSAPFELRMTEIETSLGDASLRGAATVTSPKDGTLVALQGSVAVPRLTRLLSLLQTDPPKIPAPLQKLDGTFAGQIRQNGVHISDLKLHTGIGAVQGRLSKEFSGPQIEAHLTLAYLDMDSLSAHLSGDTTGETHRTGKNTSSLSLRGTVQIGELLFRKLHLFRLLLPYTFQGNRLAVRNAEGILYGGTVRGDASLSLGRTMVVESSGVVKGANLSWLARETMERGMLEGSADLSGKISSRFTQWKEFLSGLEGTWSLRTQHGKYQALSRKKRPQGSPTHFSLLQASGRIVQGIVQSRDIFIQGDDLRINGTGELNLARQTIDCTINVDKKGVPMFPVYIEGSLDRTKTSFGAGIFFLNAIGSIFGSVIDVIR